MDRTHRCSVRVASICPCMGTAQGAGGSGNHGPATPKCSAISCPAPDTMQAHLSRSNRELTQVLPPETSSMPTPLSSTPPPVLPFSTLPSVVPSHLPPSNFPPLPPPVGSLNAPPSRTTSLRPSINTNNSLPCKLSVVL